MAAKILLVEDDKQLRKLLTDVLNAEGYDLSVAQSAEEAVSYLECETFDVLVTDVNLPGMTGIELLPICSQKNPATCMIVMTAFASIDVAVQAMRHGASDFLCKPIALHELINAVKVAVTSLETSVRRAFVQSAADSPIIANSIVMLNLLEQVKIIAPYKINALITGETGTGKELIARAIHQTSPRSKEPFVAMNCAAIPEQLLEDELFGHIKGAFTGAQTDRKGRFEQADRGTLFLDEIGDMNLALQSKLLRILQENEFERLGSSKITKVDVRVVAATSADLDQKIADGSFRPDLYHRLNVVHLKVPPLRERPDDIPPLADGLLGRFCSSVGLPPKTISGEAYATLASYPFPGNVRQLQNAMERAAVFAAAGGVIELAHLPEEIRVPAGAGVIGSTESAFPLEIPDEGINFADVVTQVERKLLLQTLDKTGGNKMQAAKLLNLKRTTLVEKIKRLQIETDEDAADLELD